MKLKKKAWNIKILSYELLSLTIVIKIGRKISVLIDLIVIL